MARIVVYVIRYQGAPYGLNEDGHEVGRADTIAGIDKVWRAEGCSGRPYENVLLAVMDDGRELSLEEAWRSVGEIEV